MIDTGEERGASGVEYGILVAGIAAVIVATALALGVEVGGAFDTFSGAYKTAKGG